MFYCMFYFTCDRSLTSLFAVVRIRATDADPGYRTGWSTVSIICRYHRPVILHTLSAYSNIAEIRFRSVTESLTTK